MAIQINQPKAQDVEKKPDLIIEKRTGKNMGKPVRNKELLFFLTQLSLMLEVGSSLSESLSVIAKQTKNKNFADVINGMLDHVAEGRQLSDAMKEYPGTFKPDMTNMIHAGESGGFLKEIIGRVIEIFEKQQKLRSQVISSMTYPAFLMGLGLLVVIFILVAILPKFMAFFEGKEHILPPTTIMMVALSNYLKNYWIHTIIGGIGLFFSFRYLLKTEYAKDLIDKLLINVPLISMVANKIYTSQLLLIMGNLLSNQGVSLVEALAITKNTCKNRYYQQFVEKIKLNVEEGGSFSEPFQDSPHMLDSVKQMVTIGEEAGNLEFVMLRLAEYYDEEVTQTLKMVSSLLEPISLIVMGAIVGVIVSSVILPMFRLSGAMH